MNIASALLKQIIVQKDLDTWAKLKEHYLPGEYQSIFRILDKHIDNYQDLPQFEDLSYEVRDRQLQEKIFAIESVDVEVDAWLLLDYLKNEYTQVEILDELDSYIDNTVAMATAEENIETLNKHFGENYVEEAIKKIEHFNEIGDCQIVYKPGSVI